MNRWIRLAAAVVAMMMIANLQYAWTLFVKPMIAATHWKLSDVQWGFTLFIAFETWLMAPAGWLIDRVGARAILSVAGVLCGVGWASLGHVHSVRELYVFYSLAGLGAALVYCGSIGVALKWFPDRRGLAAGMIAGAFGSGSALFAALIAHIIKAQDYRAAFMYTGVGQGLLIFCAAQFLKSPPASAAIAQASAVKPRKRIRNSREEFSALEMLATPHFYILFIMMLMMGVGGLIVTAQVSPLASTFGIGAGVVTLAVSLNPVANGCSRVFWGFVSDHIGREQAMFVAFLLQAIFLVNVVVLGRTSPTWFIISLALVFFTWGEVYVLFASASADFFGARNVSTNYGFLYCTKGIAAIVGGGLAAMIYERTGSWNAVFYGTAVLALISSILALVLRAMPAPTKHAAAEQAGAVSAQTQANLG